MVPTHGDELSGDGERPLWDWGIRGVCAQHFPHPLGPQQACWGHGPKPPNSKAPTSCAKTKPQIPNPPRSFSSCAGPKPRPQTLPKPHPSLRSPPTAKAFSGFFFLFSFADVVLFYLVAVVSFIYIFFILCYGSAPCFLLPFCAAFRILAPRSGVRPEFLWWEH